MLESIPDDEATLLTCGACGGEYMTKWVSSEGRYAYGACRWCCRGSQSPSEREKWKAHKQGCKESGVRRRQDATPSEIATVAVLCRLRRSTT